VSATQDWELLIGSSSIVARFDALGGPVTLRAAVWDGVLHLVLSPVEEDGKHRYGGQAADDVFYARESIRFRDWREVIV